MKLLIVTQIVDTEDPVLGFFVRWVEEFAKHAEHVEVICLKAGRFNLPENVRVHSLGKENPPRFARRLVYAIRFKWLAWQLRHEYDAVFVHMNQEYVLIAGPLWKLLGKRVYLWRNHYAGSWLTDFAAAFCTKVFCTSKHSYTAKFKKTVLMPVGVDIERFKPDARVTRVPRSILFLSRMSPSKRPEMLLDALALLARDGVAFTATFVGSPLPEHEAYYAKLKEKVRSLSLADRITFKPGVPNSETPDLYRAHEIFVNTSPSGMLDKTLFEAAASGCLVLAASKDFAELAGEDIHFDIATELSIILAKVLTGHPHTIASSVAEKNSLQILTARLIKTVASRPRRVRALVWNILSALARVVPRRPRLTILFYHSISDALDFFAVSPADFEQQMQYLEKWFDVVPLSRAFTHAAGDRVKRDSVVITMDDGYCDFVEEALPILKRHGFPATVFVLGGEPDRNELGNDIPLLRSTDAATLANPLVTIGSHSLTHKKLTKIPIEEVEHELGDSREAILKKFGTSPIYLAYPKGSVNATVARVAQEAGYEGAVGVMERSVRSGDDPYALPRVQVDASTTFPLFREKLSPAADWYYKIWLFLKR